MFLLMFAVVYAVGNLLVFLDPDDFYVRLFCAGFGFTEYILLAAARWRGAGQGPIRWCPDSRGSALRQLRQLQKTWSLCTGQPFRALLRCQAIASLIDRRSWKGDSWPLRLAELLIRLPWPTHL